MTMHTSSGGSICREVSNGWGSHKFTRQRGSDPGRSAFGYHFHYVAQTECGIVCDSFQKWAIDSSRLNLILWTPTWARPRLSTGKEPSPRVVLVAKTGRGTGNSGNA